MKNCEYNIPYDESLTLKELGYDEVNIFGSWMGIFNHEIFTSVLTKNSEQLTNDRCAVLIYSQAFDWIRKKYKLHYNIDWVYNNIDVDDSIYWYYTIHKVGNVETKGKWVKGKLVGVYPNYSDTFEISELECLREMIKLIKNNDY